jgi:hypothetical protein
MVTLDVFPIQGKTQTAEPGIEPGTSWLVARHHEAGRFKIYISIKGNDEYFA